MPKSTQKKMAESSAAAGETAASSTALGDNLRRIRTRLGLTLAEMSKRANIAQSSLWKVENHQMSLTYDKLVQLARGLNSPERMALHAAEASAYPLLKIKLDGAQPLDYLRSVRAARPDTRLVVNANQGWNFAQLKSVAAPFADLRVEMIEQPLPRGAHQLLEGFRSPVPLGADESCLHAGELDTAAARYQLINIKLDKTGGLTHALELAHAARERGLKLMVGCMGGSSLAWLRPS